MKTMKHARAFVALLLAVASPFSAIADDRKPTEGEKSKPAVRARYGADATNDGYRQLMIYSEVELSQVEYKFDGVDSWETMVVGKPPDGFGYLTTSYQPTKANQKFLVRGVRKNGSRFTNMLTASVRDSEPSLQVIGYLEESKEALLAEAKKQPVVAAGAVVAVPAGVQLSATEKEMIDEANAYRAKHGRAALQISPELMTAARSYAASGKYDHGTAGAYAARSGFAGRTTENLARGSMTGTRVIQFWGEPGVGHEKQLAGLINVNRRWVDGSFTHVGVSGVNGNWIIYFGSSR